MTTALAGGTNTEIRLPVLDSAKGGPGLQTPMLLTPAPVNVTPELDEQDGARR
jgi:hypothetical protein